MKKIIIVSLFIFLFSSHLLSNACEIKKSYFIGALTTGFVFKNDHIFKKVYGSGMANAITADVCYSRCNIWGIGAKVSYWLMSGKTTFIERDTFLQEVPITVYVRGMLDLERGLRLYGSLGVGAAWIKEKSYLGHVHTWKGLGELEVGFNYPYWNHVNFTTAFRYLFPPQSV